MIKCHTCIARLASKLSVDSITEMPMHKRNKDKRPPGNNLASYGSCQLHFYCPLVHWLQSLNVDDCFGLWVVPSFSSVLHNISILMNTFHLNDALTCRYRSLRKQINLYVSMRELPRCKPLPAFTSNYIRKPCWEIDKDKTIQLCKMKSFLFIKHDECIMNPAARPFSFAFSIWPSLDLFVCVCVFHSVISVQNPYNSKLNAKTLNYLQSLIFRPDTAKIGQLVCVCDYNNNNNNSQ